jgi:hypothetical protein
MPPLGGAIAGIHAGNAVYSSIIGKAAGDDIDNMDVSAFDPRMGANNKPVDPKNIQAAFDAVKNVGDPGSLDLLRAFDAKLQQMDPNYAANRSANNALGAPIQKFVRKASTGDVRLAKFNAKAAPPNGTQSSMDAQYQAYASGPGQSVPAKKDTFMGQPVVRHGSFMMSPQAHQRAVDAGATPPLDNVAGDDTDGMTDGAADENMGADASGGADPAAGAAAPDQDADDDLPARIAAAPYLQPVAQQIFGVSNAPGLVAVAQQEPAKGVVMSLLPAEADDDQGADGADPAAAGDNDGDGNQTVDPKNIAAAAKSVQGQGAPGSAQLVQAFDQALQGLDPNYASNRKAYDMATNAEKSAGSVKTELAKYKQAYMTSVASITATTSGPEMERLLLKTTGQYQAARSALLKRAGIKKDDGDMSDGGDDMAMAARAKKDASNLSPSPMMAQAADDAINGDPVAADTDSPMGASESAGAEEDDIVMDEGAMEDPDDVDSFKAAGDGFDADAANTDPQASRDALSPVGVRPSLTPSGPGYQPVGARTPRGAVDPKSPGVEKGARGAMRKDMFSVASMASLVSQIKSMAQSAHVESAIEGDGSPVAEQLDALVSAAGQILVNMAAEETAELTPQDMGGSGQDDGVDQGTPMVDGSDGGNGVDDTTLEMAARADLKKRGSRHSKTDMAHMQTIADHAQGIMAKCADLGVVPTAGINKSATALQKAVHALEASNTALQKAMHRAVEESNQLRKEAADLRKENVELRRLPQPPKGALRVIEKTDDDPLAKTSEAPKPTDTLGLIKAAHQRPRAEHPLDRRAGA